MKKFPYSLFALLIIISCHKDEIQSIPYNIKGSVTKGSFISGSSITFFELDEDELSQTGNSFYSSVNDDFGSYNVDVERFDDDNFVQAIGDGFYWNEVSAEVLSNKLNLIGISELSSNINLNVLTHIENERVKHLYKNARRPKFKNIKEQALEEVLDIFGLPMISGYTRAEQFDFTSDNNASKVLITVSAVIQGNRNVSEVTALLAQIADDIKEDGELNNEVIKKNIANSLYSLDADQIANNIFDRYKFAYPNLTEDSFRSDYFQNVDNLFDRYKSDQDNDGVEDALDQCPNTEEGTEVDANGCGLSQKNFGITKNVIGEGEITEELVVSTSTSEFQGGSSIKLTPEAANGWAFVEWQGDASGNTIPLLIENIDSDKEITALFERKSYELVITTQGEGEVTESIITAPSMYEFGTKVKLTAHPSNGWAFQAWEGDLNSTNNPLEIDINESFTLRAIFSQGDADNDGVPDTMDLCPDTTVGSNVNEFGCSPSQYDSDGDGVTDDKDNCPNTPEGVAVTENGCQRFIYIAENGVTVKCEGAPIGLQQEVNGKVYTVANRNIVLENRDALDCLCTSNMTDMSRLFEDPPYSLASQIDYYKMASWDVSAVTTMKEMFRDNSYIKDVDFSAWNTSNVTDMSFMFYDAGGFNGNISSWDVSSVTNMTYMFNETNYFNNNIGEWDTSNVIDMSYMFRQARAFNQDISKWNVDKVKDMSGMFSNADNFNQNLNDWDTSSVENMYLRFYASSKFNGKISNWDVSNVGDMSLMFSYATNFNSFIGLWDVSNLGNFDSMFLNATSFNQDLSLWCVDNFSTEPSNFSRDSKLNNNNKPVWGTCPEVNIGTDSNITIDERGIVRCENAAVGAKTVIDNVIYEVVNNTTIKERINDGKSPNCFCTSQVTDMSYLFAGQTDFNGDVSNFDTSNVTTMENMFGRTAINGDRPMQFNQDLSHFDTSNVVTMKNMFYNAFFNQDISMWDVSNVEDMSGMFQGYGSYRRSYFDQDISAWNVSNVENMSQMFNYSVFNQDISDWDVSSVTNMYYMFANNRYMNQNLSSWDVENVVNCSQFIRDNGGAWTRPKPNFTNCTP